MTNLERRLRKLEARVLDRHGLIRGTPRWFDFWCDKLNRMCFDEKVDLTGFTLADLDAMRENRREPEPMAWASRAGTGRFRSGLIRSP
jgi:hypothetical protein